MSCRFFILTTALALAACSGADETNTGNVEGLGTGAATTAVEDSMAQGVGAVTAPLVNNAEAFVTNAAISDMYEIEAGRIASGKARADEVRAFGEQMIKDHTATSTKLKEIVNSANIEGVTVPTTLDARRQGMIDNLRQATAEDFDTVYLDQQTAAHQEALTLMQSYADDGENDALKRFASETATKIQQHYDHVQKLDEAGADDGQ